MSAARSVARNRPAPSRPRAATYDLELRFARWTSSATRRTSRTRRSSPGAAATRPTGRLPGRHVDSCPGPHGRKGTPRQAGSPVPPPTVSAASAHSTMPRRSRRTAVPGGTRAPHAAVGPVPRLRVGDEVRAAVPQRKRVSVAPYPAHTGRGPGQFGEHARGRLDRDYLRAAVTHLPCRDPCARSHVHDQRTTQAASGQIRQRRIELWRVVRPRRRVAAGHRAEYSRHRHPRRPSCHLSRP